MAQRPKRPPGMPTDPTEGAIHCVKEMAESISELFGMEYDDAVDLVLNDLETLQKTQDIET